MMKILRLKEYLEINVKNDEQLVKVAGIVQRLIASENKGGSEDEFGLTEAEKEQLMQGIQDTVDDIQKTSDEIQDEITTKKYSIESRKNYSPGSAPSKNPFKWAFFSESPR